MSHPLLKTKIQAVKEELTVASSRLDELLGEIQVRPRAEKTAMSEVVRDAFARLNAAKEQLAELERLVLEDER